MRIPAKINLFLAVRGRRDDGYHDIVSIMQTIGVYDEVVATLHGDALAQHPAQRKHMDFHFEHDGGDAVPSDDANLALRAARDLAHAVGACVEEKGGNGNAPVTHLELRKRIPVAAGMAGGSADAAATLVALNHLWDCGLDRDEVRALAEPLGADVPFCVVGGTALATGTGAATAQVLCHGSYHWVVGVQDEPLPTADVYATWDEMSEPGEVEPDVVLQALRTDDAVTLGAALHNELQPAAFHLRPDLAEARQAMLDAGALGAVLSGSGPTMLALAADPVGAQRIAETVAPQFARVEVASSPVGGPDVIT